MGIFIEEVSPVQKNVQDVNMCRRMISIFLWHVIIQMQFGGTQMLTELLFQRKAISWLYWFHEIAEASHTSAGSLEQIVMILWSLWLGRNELIFQG